MPYCFRIMEFGWCPEKFAKVAEVMGEKVDGLSTMEAAKCAIDAQQLNAI